MSVSANAYARQCDISLIAEVVAGMEEDHRVAFLSRVDQRAESVMDAIVDAALEPVETACEIMRDGLRREWAQLAVIRETCLAAIEYRCEPGLVA